VKINILWHSLTLHLYYFLRKIIDISRSSIEKFNQSIHTVIRSIGNTKSFVDTKSLVEFCLLFLYYYLINLFDLSWISIQNIKTVLEKLIFSKSFNSTLEYILLLACLTSKALAVTLLIVKLVYLYPSILDNFHLSLDLHEAILLISWCVTTAFYTRYLIIIRLFSHDYTLVCGGTAKRHPVSYDRVSQSAANMLFAIDESQDKTSNY
jgi:hypothetical protein